MVQGITTGLTLLVLGALAPLAFRAPQQIDGAALLRLPKPMRVVCWVAIAFFASLLVGLAIALWIDASDPKLVRAAWLGVPLVAILTIGALCELRVRLTFDDEGIGGQTAFRGMRRVAWRDIIDVRWSNAGYWLRLQDRHGEVLRVSAWLQGHQLVVGKLKEHVPASTWKRAVDGWAQRAKR